MRFFQELSGLGGVHVRLITTAGSHAWRVWAEQFGQVLRVLAPGKESVR